MDQELNKELVDKLMTSPGEVRGVVFKTDYNYILREKGEDGLKKLEEELATLGCPIDYQKIETLSFHPIGLRVVSLLAIKKVFSFDDEKIKEMGVFASKTSLMLKLFINYFLSKQKVFFEEAPKIWHKHYTLGDLVPLELNEEKNYSIFQIKNNKELHPLFCLYLGSYFCGFFHMLIKSDEINFEETKCLSKGDEYHEYKITWK